MELYDGRPDDLAGRLPREVRTYDYLDSLGIPNTRAFDGVGHSWFTWRINLADYLENYLWK